MNYYGSQAASGMRVPKPRMTTTFVCDGQVVSSTRCVCVPRLADFW